MTKDQKKIIERLIKDKKTSAKMAYEYSRVPEAAIKRYLADAEALEALMKSNE